MRGLLQVAHKWLLLVAYSCLSEQFMICCSSSSCRVNSLFIFMCNQLCVDTAEYSFCFHATWITSCAFRALSEMLFWTFPVAGLELCVTCSFGKHRKRKDHVQRKDPWWVSQCRAFHIDIVVMKWFHCLQLLDSISILWECLYYHWRKGLFLFGFIVLWLIHTFSFCHFIF